MKTFEQLFRAMRSDSSKPIVDDMLVKGANGEYWNARVKDQYEWFKTGQAQNMAMLKALAAIAKAYVESVPKGCGMREPFIELMTDVEEVLKNEQA